MHELQIAHDLAVIVVEAANRERLNRVTSVNLQFGEMIQIVPDIFKFAFDEATKGTLAQDAEIILEIIPIRIRCGNCQKEADIENLTFRCTFCNSSNINIINGKELIIKSIEGD